ncbi:hypothetical protein OHA21_05250 [Actinoplanes sp. NBC_00393]
MTISKGRDSVIAAQVRAVRDSRSCGGFTMRPAYGVLPGAVPGDP